jgi:hypothetical protein
MGRWGWGACRQTNPDRFLNEQPHVGCLWVPDAVYRITVSQYNRQQRSTSYNATKPASMLVGYGTEDAGERERLNLELESLRRVTPYCTPFFIQRIQRQCLLPALSFLFHAANLGECITSCSARPNHAAN